MRYYNLKNIIAMKFQTTNFERIYGKTKNSVSREKGEVNKIGNLITVDN